MALARHAANLKKGLLVGWSTVSKKPIALKLLRHYSDDELPSYFNKDWKPGPFPRTEEERIAAAKKYNMIPEDYKTYPEEGNGYGDYPMVEELSADSRDPFHPWDHGDVSRDHGEPVPWDFDWIGHDRIDVSEKPFIPDWQKRLWFFGFYGTLYAYLAWEFDYVKYQPMMNAQMPGDGQVHYTFELVDK